MTPQEIVAEVLAITKRPDKEARTYVALNKALRKLSSSTELARDLVEGLMDLEFPSEYTHSLPLTLFPEFRKFCYIRPSGYKKPLTLIVPDNLLDEDCRERTDCYYVAGANAHLSLAKLQTKIQFGYYAFPARVDKAMLPEAVPWLCHAAEWVLFDMVAADIFRNIGDEQSANQHEADARLSWESLKQDLKYGGLP